MNLKQKLSKIQFEINVPKNQYNSFGKYHYRNCEDILAAAKPLLAEHGLILTISDDIVEIGGRHYVKATAILSDIEDDDGIAVSALAREEENRKGMDSAQLTGATSSYARKYALNGLFCLDDVKDADATNTHGKGKQANQKVDIETLQKIADRADQVGMDKDSLLEMAKEMFGVTKSTDLTTEQAEELDNQLMIKLEGK